MSEAQRHHEPAGKDHSPREGEPQEGAFVDDAFGEAVDMVKRADAQIEKAPQDRTRPLIVLRNALIGMLFLVVGDAVNTEASHEQHSYAVNCSAFLDSRDRTACRRFNQEMEQEQRRRERAFTSWDRKRRAPLHVPPPPGFRAEVALPLLDREKGPLIKEAEDAARADFYQGTLQEHPRPKQAEYNLHPQAVALFENVYRATVVKLVKLTGQRPQQSPSRIIPTPPPPRSQSQDEGPTFTIK